MSYIVNFCLSSFIVSHFLTNIWILRRCFFCLFRLSYLVNADIVQHDNSQLGEFCFIISSYPFCNLSFSHKLCIPWTGVFSCFHSFAMLMRTWARPIIIGQLPCRSFVRVIFSEFVILTLAAGYIEGVSSHVFVGHVVGQISKIAECRLVQLYTILNCSNNDQSVSDEVFWIYFL